MAKGGVLGFAGNPVYAHNRSDEAVYLPSKLKGVDMVIYATCKSLGLQVAVRPVFDQSRPMDHFDSWEGDNNGYESEDDPKFATGAEAKARSKLRHFQQHGTHSALEPDSVNDRVLVLEDKEYDADQLFSTTKSFAERLADIKSSRGIVGLPSKQKGPVDFISRSFTGIQLEIIEVEDESDMYRVRPTP